MADITITVAQDVGQQWTLTGPDGVVASNVGPAIVRNVATGDYTIAWSSPAGYVAGTYTSGPHTVGAGGITLASPSYSATDSNVQRYWANTGCEKITQDDLRATKGTAGTNTIWNGDGTVRVWGCRNEIVEFSVYLEAPNNRTDEVTVEFIADLSNGSGGFLRRSTRVPYRQTGVKVNNWFRTDAQVVVSPEGEEMFDWTATEVELFYIGYQQIRGGSNIHYAFVYDYGVNDELRWPERLRRPLGAQDSNNRGYAGVGTWYDRPDADKFYPDVCYPMETKQGFVIQAGECQQIWCDIYIPKTATGVYTGTLRVTENGKTPLDIPVEVTVRGAGTIMMPDVPSQNLYMFLSDYDCNRRLTRSNYPYSNPTQRALSIRYRQNHFKVAHRHRIDLVGDEDQSNFDEFLNGTVNGYGHYTNVWQPRLDGTLFTSANGYAGPGVGIGLRNYFVGSYGKWVDDHLFQHGVNFFTIPVPDPADPTSNGYPADTYTDIWASMDAWKAWFDANYDTVTDPVTAETHEVFRSLYLWDEPSLDLIDDNPANPTLTEQTKLWANALKYNPGDARGTTLLPLFVTIGAHRMLNNDNTGITEAEFFASAAAEIAFQNPLDSDPHIAAALADPNKRFFIYNGQRSYFGTMNQEVDGVDQRMTAWATHKLGYDGWFYWSTNFYTNFTAGDFQLRPARVAQTFGRFEGFNEEVGEWGTQYTNGDGVIFYPGVDAYHPGDTSDILGPIASIRLKLVRRGSFDADYLKLATAVDSVATDAIVDATLPAVLNEKGPYEDPVEGSDHTYSFGDVSWSNDPDVWENARASLADIIEGV